MTVSKLTGRLARLVAAGALALGVIGLAAPAASAHTGSGWLRLAHLSPNTPAVDVYLYSFDDPTARIVLKHVAYGTVSTYQQVPAGEYTVAMRAAGAMATSKPVLSTVVDVDSGRAYTVAGVGPYSGLRLQVWTDRLGTPKGKALVRIIEASMRQERATFTVDGKTLASNLAFSRSSGYTVMSPGTVTVHAAGSSESTTKKIHLTAGTTNTFVLLDSASSLTIHNLVDARGSRVTPQGGAQTGFGGTAARPGAALLPWAGASSVGLLVIVTGGFLAGRRRRPAMHAR